jgi:hypothetical protein
VFSDICNEFPIFVSGKIAPNMKVKLIELYHLLKDATNEGLLIRALTYDKRKMELVAEILTGFSLPVNEGYVDIPISFRC